MRQYAILRLLLATFFLYIAWPYFPHARVGIELLFWGSWIVFCLLVIGANLAILLEVMPPKRGTVTKPEEGRLRNY